MKKLLIATALLFTALPFTFDGVTPTVSKAHAIIGRPLTPFSVAGVHRRAVRRTIGVGPNLGYRGFYHRNYAYHRFHPVARVAWGGGWGGWGWRPGLYAYAAAPGWGGGWGGWGGGWGWGSRWGGWGGRGWSNVGWGGGGWGGGCCCCVPPPPPPCCCCGGWGGGGWGGGGW